MLDPHLNKIKTVYLHEYFGEPASSAVRHRDGTEKLGCNESRSGHYLI